MRAPSLAIVLGLAPLFAASAPPISAVRAQEAPPPPAPGADEAEPKAPAPTSPPAPAAPAAGAPVSEAAPKTVEEAYRRLEDLRRAPLVGAGSFVRRLARVKALAAEALAIHARTPAAGEDLHRLAEICADGERYEEAAALAEKYVASGGATPPPGAGHAHSLRVRSLAKCGKIPEAEAAFRAYREAFPKGDGLAPALKSVGDALVLAGKVPDAAARYAAALDLHPRPLRAGTAPTVQALCETLVALGRAGEAQRTAAKAANEIEDRQAQARVHAVLRRAEMAEKPFATPAVGRWIGGPGPTAESLKGKVVVWHFFAWWMQPGAEEIAAWEARSAELAAKGIVFLPVTRAAGYDPATEKLDPDVVKPEAEAASFEAFRKERGWKAAVGFDMEGKAFASLRIRGVPTDIVVGRDGRVRFVRGGSEAGEALTWFAAQRAAEEAVPAPAPPAAPPAAPPEPGGK